MPPIDVFTRRVAIDLAWIALVGGGATAIWRGEAFGVSFAAGCLWLGLNIVILGMLMGALLGPKDAPKLLAIGLSCAKIPVAYLLLLWLLSRDFLTPVGIAAALIMLPAVIVFRGLAGWGRALPVHPMRKEEI